MAALLFHRVARQGVQIFPTIQGTQPELVGLRNGLDGVFFVDGCTPTVVSAHAHKFAVKIPYGEITSRQEAVCGWYLQDPPWCRARRSR